MNMKKQIRAVGKVIDSTPNWPTPLASNAPPPPVSDPPPRPKPTYEENGEDWVRKWNRRAYDQTEETGHCLCPFEYSSDGGDNWSITFLGMILVDNRDLEKGWPDAGKEAEEELVKLLDTIRRIKP